MWITWGLLWCFYQLFGLSFWRHPFTAEDHWWASDVTLHFSKSVLMKKQTWIRLGVNYLQMFNFKRTIPLRTCFSEDIFTFVKIIHKSFLMYRLISTHHRQMNGSKHGSCCSISQDTGLACVRLEQLWTFKIKWISQQFLQTAPVLT